MLKFLKRPILRLALAASLLAACNFLCFVAAQDTVELSGLGPAVVPLDGQWRFQPGDNLQWAQPGFDDSLWPAILTGKAWEGQGHPDLKGFAWYRKRIAIAPNTSSGTSSSLNLALLLENVDSSCEVYWNGVRVGSYGRVPPHALWYWGLQYPIVIPLGHATTGVLAIRVWRAPDTYSAFENEGGLMTTPRLTTVAAGEEMIAAAHYRWLNSQLYLLMLGVLTTAASVIALLVWLRNRRQGMLLWLSIYLLRVPLLILVDLPGVSWRLGYGTIGSIFAATDAVLWVLLLYLLNLRDNPKLVHWTQALAIFVVVCQGLEGSEQFFNWERAPRFFLFADVALTIPALILEGYGLVLLGFALRKRLDAPRWCVAISAAVAQAYSGVFSTTNLGQRWTHWTVGQKITAVWFSIGGSAFTSEILINTALLISLLYAAWRYAREEAERQAQVTSEYRSAQAVQQRLIPEELPQIPGLRFASAYLPAGEVGGDFFQILPVARGETLIAIGDVSGKGMPAAMTVAMLVGALGALAQSATNPAEILRGMNLRMLARKGDGFATCLILLLHGDGTITLANAAHIPPYAEGKEMCGASGLPLGLSADEVYESCSIHLEPGQSLTLMTDGVLEARSKNGELFGFERTAAISTRSAEAIAHAAQAHGQEDDITVLTLTRMSILEPATVGAHAL